MTVIAVLSQPLREKEAAVYLHKRRGARNVVVTRFLDELDSSAFPPDTTFLAWSPTHRTQRPSARVATMLGRLKKWVRSGSTMGLRIDRWVRSADWRFRYMDRLVSVVEAGRGSHWAVRNDALNQVLESEIGDRPGSEIAVFDLFDLPTVVSFATTHQCSVVVR